MECFSHDEGDGRVFNLKGRLEFGEFPDSKLILEALEADEIRRIVIDLEELEFMDSMGVGLLIGFNKTAIEKGKTISLRGAQGAVKELVDLFQLETVFEVR